MHDFFCKLALHSQCLSGEALENIHIGEVVETKGGNHKTLKEWKAKYGSEKVESWLTK